MKWLTIILLLISVHLFAPDLPKNYLNNQQGSYQSEKLKFEISIAEDQYQSWADTLSYRESRKNPNAGAGSKYIGLFQFGKRARKATGFAHIEDPHLWPVDSQVVALNRLIDLNYRHLKPVIDSLEAIDYKIDGILITKSGFLAAAHLGGSGGVRKYISGEKNARDKNGTKVSDYMKEFSGYNF